MKRLTAFVLFLVFLLPIVPIHASEAYQTDIAMSVGADETQRNLVWYALSSVPGTMRLWVAGAPMEEFRSYPSTVSKASDGEYYVHRVTVTDLLPGMDYTYQLVNDSIESPLYSFSTASSGSFSFVFAGDPQLGESKDPSKDRDGWALALDRITNHTAFSDSAFLLIAGDHVDEKNNESHFDDLLHHDAMTGIAMANTIGNHEAKSEIFSQHFFRPNESEEYGVTTAGGDAYFLYNNVLFFLINSNDKDTDEHRTFMESVLSKHPNALWKVVSLHHSLYTVANHAYDDSILSRREELVPLFQELGIDAVFSGHDHVYCRSYLMDGLTPLSHVDYYDQASKSSATNPEGILYLTANSSSGSKTYDPKEDFFPYSAEHHQYNAGELSRISVTDHSFTISTYRTDTMELLDSFALYRKDEAPHPFTDVSSHSWYNRGIQYAYSHELMNGMGNNLFSPDSPTTRAMAVTLLYRLEGSPKSGAHSFTDVPTGSYYENAAAWATEKGIVKGITPDRFAPEQPITREQLVTIFARYARHVGIGTESKDSISTFADSALVSPYAAEAMNWALQAGLIQGTGKNYLTPQGTVTRAQVAVILMRMSKLLHN